MNHALPLKPIHLPPAPGWWPPAPGWWLLALLTLILLGLCVWWWRRWRARRQKQQWLTAELARLADSHKAADLHRLLRRAILPLLPPQAHEPDWQATLTHLAGAQPVAALLQLESARFQPDVRLSTEALEQARPLLMLTLLQPRKARKRLTNQTTAGSKHS